MRRRWVGVLSACAAGCGGATTSDPAADAAAPEASLVDVVADTAPDGGAAIDGGAGPDAAPDAPDAAIDAPADVELDGPFGWATALDGVWLIGWIGDLNHFSWVRLHDVDQLGGAAEFLDGSSLTANIPYWPCNGAGTWMITQKPRTIGLYFPSSCGVGFQDLTFETFSAPGAWPNGATLAATVTSGVAPAAMQAYRFPASQCDAAMTACQDPFP